MRHTEANGSHYLAKLLPRSLSSIRIFEFLSSAKHVLVAGIGGSYDFMSGLPIVFHLIGRRKERLPRQPLLVWQRFRAEQQEGRSPLHSSRFRLISTSQYFPEKYYTEWHERQFGSRVQSSYRQRTSTSRRPARSMPLWRRTVGLTVSCSATKRSLAAPWKTTAVWQPSCSRKQCLKAHNVPWVWSGRVSWRFSQPISRKRSCN